MKNQVSRYYCKNCGHVQSISKGNRCIKCDFKSEEIKSNLDVYSKISGYIILIVVGLALIFLSFTIMLNEGGNFPDIESHQIYTQKVFGLLFSGLMLCSIGGLLWEKILVKLVSNIKSIGYSKYGAPKTFDLSNDSTEIKINNEQGNENQKPIERFNSLKNELIIVNKKIDSLTDKLTKGEISSDAFTKANDNLERKRKEIEEKLWKLRNMLFKEEYEKPF
jgi:hypothetical protein